MHLSDAMLASWLSRRLIKRGIEAGLLASVPQVLLPKIEERLLLGRGENADIGPRFVERLARMSGTSVREDTKWIAASAFHFGYATFWGVLYALAWRRWRPNPMLGGSVLSAVIYALAFPHWGGAVLTKTEPPPQRRPWRRELILATAAGTFGLLTAVLYGRPPLRRRRSRARGEARGYVA